MVFLGVGFHSCWVSSSCYLGYYYIYENFSYELFSGITAGIYTTNSAEAVFHVLHSSHANIVVVDDNKQMAKIREIRHRLPLLKAAIQIQGPFDDYVRQDDGYFKVNYVFISFI